MRVWPNPGGHTDYSAFGLFELEDGKSGGDEFMAVKPWIGAIIAPSSPPASDPSPPSASIDLEWVHGYSAQASRNSLRYCQTTARSSTGKGDIVYPAAALGVVLDLSSRRQRFSRNVPGNVGCSDDVISLAVSPNGQFVALGEIGKRANVIVFDVMTMATLAVIPGHKRGVTEVAFSNDGTLLASVGLDDEHRVRRRCCEGGGGVDRWTECMRPAVTFDDRDAYSAFLRLVSTADHDPQLARGCSRGIDEGWLGQDPVCRLRSR